MAKKKEIPEPILKLADKVRELKDRYEAIGDELGSCSQALEAYMEKYNIPVIASPRAIACFMFKGYRKLAPEDFYEATGGDLSKLFSVCSVRLDETKSAKGANSYFSKEELESLVTTTNKRSLKVIHNNNKAPEELLNKLLDTPLTPLRAGRRRGNTNA